MPKPTLKAVMSGTLPEPPYGAKTGEARAASDGLGGVRDRGVYPAKNRRAGRQGAGLGMWCAFLPQPEHRPSTARAPPEHRQSTARAPSEHRQSALARARSTAYDVKMITQNIKVERARLGLTQAQLAELSGVCRATINHIERGKMPGPRYSTLERIAKALGISTRDLLA